MAANSIHDEEDLACLLRLLPPAPEGWVRAAQELPRARRELDQILALAETDAEFRRALLADLEGALGRAGFEPGPELLERLRAQPPRDADEGTNTTG
jgi:hypothetical protein